MDVPISTAQPWLGSPRWLGQGQALGRPPAQPGHLLVQGQAGAAARARSCKAAWWPPGPTAWPATSGVHREEMLSCLAQLKETKEIK